MCLSYNNNWSMAAKLPTIPLHILTNLMHELLLTKLKHADRYSEQMSDDELKFNPLELMLILCRGCLRIHRVKSCGGVN